MSAALNNPLSSLPTASMPFRMRADLEVVQTSTLPIQWTVKDPISSRHLTFSEEEWKIVSVINKASSYDELVLLCRKQLAIEESEIRRKLPKFLMELRLSGLLTLDATSSLSFFKRDVQQPRFGQSPAMRSLQGFNKALNWLIGGTICRFSIEPARGLLERVGFLLFSNQSLRVLFVLSSISCVVLIGAWDKLFAELGNWRELISPSYLVLFGTITLLVKVFHEIGHAATAQFFGRSCRTAGVMHFLGVPLFYVDASDSMLLKERGERVRVILGGVIAETWVSAIAILVWSVTLPGGLHFAALYTFLVSLTSNLLININPLMRFDGYYLLSELAKRPQLNTDSKAALSYWLERLTSIQILQTRREFPLSLALYSILSSIYRVTVFVAIAWAMHWLGVEYGLGGAVDLLVVVLIGSIVFSEIARRIQTMQKANDRSRIVNWRNGFAIFFLALLLLLPWRSREVIQGEFVDAQAQPIYVESNGIVRFAVDSSKENVAKQHFPDLTIFDPTTEAKFLQKKSEIAEVEAQQETLERQQAGTPDRTSTGVVESLRSRLAGLELEQRQLAEELGRRHLESVEFASIQPVTVRADEVQRLDRDEGVAIRNVWDKEASGVYLPAGSLIGFGLQEKEWLIEFTVSESWQNDLEIGDHLLVRPSASPHVTIPGKITKIAAQTEETEPNGFELQDANRAGEKMAASPKSFRVSAQIVPPTGLSLEHREPARVLVYSRSRSLLSRCWNYFRSELNFGM